MECKNIYVFEENFYYTQESERKTNEQLPVNIESSASLNEEDKKIKIEMIITIGSKESPNYDFFYNIRLVGIFNGLIEDYNEKSIKDGREIVYSFARTYFYQMLKKAGLSTVILPHLNQD